MLVVYTVHKFFVTHTHMQVFYKVPYYAYFTLAVFSNNKMCFYPVNELSRNEKGPSFVSFACLAFQKLCA